MNWVYIIKNIRHRRIYIGQTRNLVKRLGEHNSGLAPSTKPYRPWKFVYIEGYANENEAKDREEKFKQFGKVYSQLKRRIGRSLQS